MQLVEYIKLLTESVSIGEVNNAIDTHTRILINYHSKGEDIASGARIIEVYAYGLTKAGNPVIRAFQPYGDTTTTVPSWKFFRLDRISFWKNTGQKFSRPASDYYKGLGEFNPYGDKTMSTVYKIAKFDGYDNNAIKPINHSSPKIKQTSKPSSLDTLYKTDTEKNMERLRQQMNNPIKLSDIKTKQGFRQYNNNNNKTNTEYGPKMKPQLSQDNTLTVNQQKQEKPNKTDTNLYKTDTERGMENLRQQLQNPRKIDLSKIPRR